VNFDINVFEWFDVKRKKMHLYSIETGSLKQQVIFTSRKNNNDNKKLMKLNVTYRGLLSAFASLNHKQLTMLRHIQHNITF